MAFVRLPNGSDFPVLEGESPQDALLAALRKYPEAFGLSSTEQKEDTSGFTAAAAASYERLKGEAALTAGKAGLMDLAEAEKYRKEREAAAEQRFTPTQDDWTTSPWLKLKELAGGSAPYMAAPLVAGAAAASLPVSGPTAAVLGALGAGAVSAGQFTGSNLARQMETGKTLEETDLGKAALTAVPQAALDTASMLLAPGLGKLLGVAGREVTEAGAKALANQTLKQVAIDYTKATGKAMTVEGLTESAQQLLERAQAGLALDDPEARKEYLESLQGGAALAAVLGPFGRAVDRGSIKAQGKKLEEARLAEERTVAEAEQAKVDAAAAAEKQTPEYLQELAAQFQTLEQERQALPKVEKPKKVKDATPEQEVAYEDAMTAYEEAKAAKTEFFDRYKPVRQEYKERLADIQALQPAAQQEEAMQGGAGPMAQPTLPGFELGAEQPGAAEQRAIEQEARQYFQQPAEETQAAPAQAEPAQPGLDFGEPAPAAPVAPEAEPVSYAGEMENVQAGIPTLESLQAEQKALTDTLTKAKAAKVAPVQIKAVTDQLSTVQQDIAKLKSGKPLELAPVQQRAQDMQRVDLMQQRDALETKQKQLRDVITDVNTAPQERVSLGRQATQITTALKDINAQLKPLGGAMPTLEGLQKQEATLTTQLTKATKAKALPQVQALNTKLLEVKQQIASFAAPAVEGQGALDLQPREEAPEAAPLPKAKTERGGQKVLPGFQPQGVQAAAPATETATAEDLTDDIRKLEALAERQYEKVAASTLETFPAENKKAEAIRARIQELEQQRESAPKMVQSATEAEAEAYDANILKLEEGVTKAEKEFYEAKDEKGDFSRATTLLNRRNRLKEKLEAARAEPRPQAQIGLEAQPALLEARETALAEEIATGREAAVERRKQGEADALLKADVGILKEKAATPAVGKELRQLKQKEMLQAKKERRLQEEKARHQRRVELQNAKRGEAAKPVEAPAAAEPKAETKAEPKTEPKTETKAEPKTETKAEPKATAKAEPKATAKAKTMAEEVAKAEAETKKLSQEQPDLFDDANFDSDTDTASDTALREDDTFYEVRPTTDLSEAARDAAEDGNVADLLTELAKSKNALHREIATRLQTLMSGLGRRPKIVVADNLMDNGKRVEGYYTASKNRITVDSESLTEETVIHELVHAVTLGVLRADPSTLTAEQRAARADLERIFNKIKTDPAFAKEYGTVNLEEFAAEVLTNSQLRDKLNQKKSDGKSILQSIYQALMRLIGLDPDSMAAEAVEATFKLFQPPSTAIKDPTAIPSIMRGVFPGTKAVAAANVDQGVVNTVNSLVGRSAAAGDRITASALGMRMRTMIADRWAPIEELIKQGIAKGEVKMAQAMQLRFLMRVSEDTSRLVSMAINDSVPQFVRGADGVITLKSSGSGVNAKQMAQALSGSKLGNAQFVENLATSWLGILRAEKEGIGYDKLNYGKDVLNAEKAQAIKNTVESDPATKAAFAEFRRLYKQYNKELLQMYVDSGSMSQEKANELLKGDYVPYYRINGGIVELVVGGGKKVTIGSVIDQPQLKELVGGEDKILPIFSGMVQNTSLLMRSAVRNMQMRDVGNMLQDRGMAKIVKGEGPRDVFTARFKKNGESYYVRLDETAFPGNVPAEVVIMGLQGIKTAIPAGVELMQLPVNLLRKGITRMPTYALRQLLRDPVHAWMTTGGDFSVLIDTYKEFFKSLKSATPTELSLQRAGAISSNVQHLGSQEDVATMLRDITSGKSGWNFNGILAKLDTLGMKADAATRSAVYNSYRKKGMSHTEAVLGAAESMNFSRRGTSASLHWLSTMIPFFNAQIQGLDSVYRAGVKGDTLFQDKLDVRAKLIKRGALMAGMTLAYAVMMQDDEAYKNATPFERAQSWFIRIPGVKEPIKIPIPFELGLVFKAIPEMAYSTAFGDTKARDARDAMGKLLVQAQPLGLPAGVKPLIELASNYNFFTDAPIISRREETLTTDQQFRNSTSELAKLLGKTGAVSPLSVDHLIRSYTGGLGMLLVQMGDYPLRPFVSPSATDRPTKNLNEMPVFGSMFQPADGRGIINAAFKDIEQFQKAATTYKGLIGSGDNAEAAAFANKYARDIALTSVGGSFKQKMGELASLKRQIASMPGMSSDEKQSQINSVKKLEIQLATMIRQMSSAP